MAALTAGNTISPSGNARIKDQMPIVPSNAMVKDPKELGNIPLRPGDVEMPPLPDRSDLRRFARPAVLLAGEHDRYAPPEDLRAYGALFPHAEVVVVPGTDHYFWRREKEAASVIGTFADRALTRP